MPEAVSTDLGNGRYGLRCPFVWGLALAFLWWRSLLCGRFLWRYEWGTSSLVLGLRLGKILGVVLSTYDAFLLVG